MPVNANSETSINIPMTTLLLIRHASTDAVGKRLSGRKPGITLNDPGRRQAQHLSQAIQHVPIQAIYSSPLARTAETAAYIAAGRNIEVVYADDLLEINFGEWTDSTFASLAGENQFHLFNLFRSNTPVPGGETMLQAQTRFIGALQSICANHSGQTVAVVSYSDLVKAAVAFYAGIPLDLFQRIEISPASISVIDIHAEMPVIRMVNYTGNFIL